MARRTVVPVGVETGAKRVFAFAVDWPGWCRTAETEAGALEALAEYAPRYAPVAARAGIAFPMQFELSVTDRAQGTATTDFGAPDARLPGDARRLRDAAAIRAFREAIASACLEGAKRPPADAERASLWPVRYFIRRLTWHALDHAWEMEDRSPGTA